MATTTFITTKINFQTNNDIYEVCTDADYVYIDNGKIDAEQNIIKISIEDWDEIVKYIKKELK